MSRRSLKATAVVLALPCVAGKSAAATFFFFRRQGNMYCTDIGRYLPIPVEGKTGGLYRFRVRIDAWKLRISSKSAGIYCTYGYGNAGRFLQSAAEEVASVCQQHKGKGVAVSVLPRYIDTNTKRETEKKRRQAGNQVQSQQLSS